MSSTPNIKNEAHLIKIWSSYKESLKKEAEKWGKVQYVGKDGDKVTDYPKLPLTLEGFKVFCHETGIGYIHQYFENTDKRYNDYMGVCSRVREEIRYDQITGGLLGVYNSSITQRLNGLVDKKQTEIKGEPRVFNIPTEDDEE
jgi:hypothetical protein